MPLEDLVLYMMITLFIASVYCPAQPYNQLHNQKIKKGCVNFIEFIVAI